MDYIGPIGTFQDNLFMSLNSNHIRKLPSAVEDNNIYTGLRIRMWTSFGKGIILPTKTPALEICVRKESSNKHILSYFDLAHRLKSFSLFLTTRIK